MTALIDTSILVERETRPAIMEMPEEWFVSAVTLGELHTGVLIAQDEMTRARRMLTLAYVESGAGIVPFDAASARVFGRLASAARLADRKGPPKDSLIAATAIAHRMTLYTLDHDFTTFEGLDLVLVSA